jgi:hypothetical protein
MSGIYPIGSGGPGVDSFATVQEAAGALNSRGLAGNVEFPITQFIYPGPVALRNVASSRDYTIKFLPKSAGATIDAAGARYAFSVESTHNVTVQQMRFQGARDTGSACIRFVDSDSGLVWACRMVSDSAATGLLVERAVNFRLDSSRVQGAMRASGSRGIDFRECRYTWVYRCSILGTLNTGISIVGGNDNVTMMTGIRTASDTGYRVVNSPRMAVDNLAVHGSTDYGLHIVNTPLVCIDSALIAGTHRQSVYFESCDSLNSTALMLFGTSERGAEVVRSRDCYFMRLTIQTGPKRGLVLDHSPGAIIDSLQVVNVDSDTAIGVLLDSSPNSTFRWAMLYGSYGRAFSVSRSSGSRFVHARMHGAAAEAAMTFSQSSGVKVQPCSLVCAAPASVVLNDSCNDDTLARMTILGTTDVGITALNCRGLVLANNCIRGWTDLGVALRNVRSPRVCYNTIVSPESVGNVVVDLANVTGAEAKDNIVWNRGRYGSTCYDISEAFPFAPGASDYNDLHTSGDGSVARVNETAYATLVDWRGHASSPDGHSLSRDPLFLPGDDYHLSSTSPCRDSGIPVAGWLYDIELDERDTLAPDIGADEFRPGAVGEETPVCPRIRLEAAGNPFADRAGVRYSLPVTASVRLRVFDASGRLVLAGVEQRQGPGKYDSELDFGRLSAGVYLLRLQAGSSAASLKLVKQ